MKKYEIDTISICINLLLLTILAGCKTIQYSETERLEASIMKELPFHVKTLEWTGDPDFTTFRFSCSGYVSTPPDAEINYNGELLVSRTTVFEKPTHQDEAHIWRNVVVSKKNKRIICVDRFLKEGKTHGYIYVLQTESKKYPNLGTFHWDVSDSHNIESVGLILNDIRQISLKKMFNPKEEQSE